MIQFVAIALLIIPCIGTDVRGEWHIDYKWSTIDFNLWAPESASELVVIKITFEDFVYPTNYDRIILNRTSIVVRQMRQSRVSANLYVPLNITDHGWLNFKLIIDSNYGLIYKEEPLITLGMSVVYTPDCISLKGSNITLSHNPKTRIWNVAEEAAIVPLDNLIDHKLVFYSIKEFMPKLEIQERIFMLGWYNESISTIPALIEELPPFILHEIVLECNKTDIVSCIIYNNNRELEKTLVATIPESIYIYGLPDDDFFVLLVEKEEVKEIETTQCINSSRSVIASLLVTCMCLLVSIVVLKRRKIIIVNVIHKNNRNIIDINPKN